MVEDELSNLIIGCAIEVHRRLGPGLLENTYKECLFYELEELGLKVVKEKPINIEYKKLSIDNSYRIDILVENKVVIELKSVEKFTDVHTAQMITYLKLGHYRLGLLLNFNVKILKNGIRRVIL